MHNLMEEYGKIVITAVVGIFYHWTTEWIFI